MVGIYHHTEGFHYFADSYFYLSILTGRDSPILSIYIRGVLVLLIMAGIWGVAYVWLVYFVLPAPLYTKNICRHICTRHLDIIFGDGVFVRVRGEYVVSEAKAYLLVRYN